MVRAVPVNHSCGGAGKFPGFSHFSRIAAASVAGSSS